MLDRLVSCEAEGSAAGGARQAYAGLAIHHHRSADLRLCGQDTCMSAEHLIRELEQQRDTLIAVATGRAGIDTVNEEYRTRRRRVTRALRERGLEDPCPYSDLWAWWEYCSSRLPTYAARRGYVAQLYDPLLDDLRASEPPDVVEDLTGWERVDRGLGKARRELEVARNEEEFQAVGLHCREVLISVGEIVFDAENHAPPGEPIPSKTDAKRCLEAFFASNLRGASFEEARALAKAAVKFAYAVQHKRTATYRDAALCVEATSAVTRLASVLAEQRGPMQEATTVDDLPF